MATLDLLEIGNALASEVKTATARRNERILAGGDPMMRNKARKKRRWAFVRSSDPFFNGCAHQIALAHRRKNCIHGADVATVVSSAVLGNQYWARICSMRVGGVIERQLSGDERSREPGHGVSQSRRKMSQANYVLAQPRVRLTLIVCGGSDAWLYP
jgi:hypothetical protein